MGNRLINPNSFLTAIKQVFCRESNPQQELNKTIIQTDVLKKMYWEADLPDLNRTAGALVFGFQVEGAHWDINSGNLDESLPKTSFSIVPVVNCKAVIMTGKVDKSVIAGVAMVLDVPGAGDLFAPGKDPTA